MSVGLSELHHQSGEAGAVSGMMKGLDKPPVWEREVRVGFVSHREIEKVIIKAAQI